MIDKLVLESREIRPYLSRLIEDLSEKPTESIILEGVNLLPEFSFGVRNVRSVYLIDTSPDQWRRIVGFDDESS